MNALHRLARMPWRRVGAAALLILVFGAARMPFEHAIEKELRAAGFRDWSPNISNREQLGQAGFAGALGGFRSLVALLYDVKAHTARQDKQWDEVERFRTVTTTLQPRYWKHWDNAAWDMAWNAYAYYRGIADEYADEFRGWQTENIIMPRFLEKGIEFAQRGMKWLPDSFIMPRVVAEIYAQKYEDHCAAADWHLKASQAPDAPPFVYRAHVHHLALCEGREEEAFRKTAELYWGGQRTLTVRHDMENLEDELARRAATEKTRAQLEAEAAAPGATYRELAALAMHLLEVAGDLPAATQIYGALAREPDVPSFYRKKWAFLLARDPDRAPLAYRALKALFQDDPDALQADDVKMLSKLEERLEIPKEQRVIEVE